MSNMVIASRLNYCRERNKMTWNTYAHLYPSAEDSALEALENA